MRLLLLVLTLFAGSVLIGCDTPTTLADNSDLVSTGDAADSGSPKKADQGSSADQSSRKKDVMTNTASDAQKPEDADEKSASAVKTVIGPYNPLNEAEAYVILRQGTEPPGDGGYTLTKDPGTYICRRCNSQLYLAVDKFESHCGWPSFDDEIKGAVTRRRDVDGYRVEIVCSNCAGHLGHVFEGERLTAKNTRHCVNSISMKFIPEGKEIPAKIIAPKNVAPKERSSSSRDDKAKVDATKGK